jgi:DNA-directed RNA polymerase specialized sigma24 family protein
LESVRNMIREVAIDADDRDVIRLAYERHQAALFRLAGLLSGDRAEAADIVQEAFLRAAPQLGRIVEQEQLAYLRIVCLNLWRSRHRRLSVARRHSERRTRGVASNVVPFEERDEMWRAVLGLPPRQRACLVLRF